MGVDFQQKMGVDFPTFFFVNIILFQLQFAIPFATSEKSTSIVGKSAISSITTEAWDFFFGDPGELGPTVGDWKKLVVSTW